MKVTTYPMGPLGENTYLCKDEDTGYCAVIDPGYYGDEIVSEIGDKSNLKYVFLTHGHFDHIYHTGAYKDNYPDTKIVGPEKEKYLLSKDWNKDYLAIGHNTPPCPPMDIFVKEGDTITLGSSVFEFIETPGHTEGGMCIKCGKSLFSGDTLFRLSVGNTSFETGNWNELVKSVHEKLYVLDEDTVVYPGHGGATEIGFEKRSNPFV